jgi:capsule polysaccharide export protein KpsE/RkpR
MSPAVAAPHHETEQISTAAPPNWLVHATVLWEHRQTLARVTAIALTLGLCLAFAIPKRYRSSTSIMPPAQQGSSAMLLSALAGRTGGLGGLGSLGGLAGGLLSSQSTTALYISLLESGTVRGHLIDRFGLQKLYRNRYRIDTAKHLAGLTAIADDKKSGVITIAVEDTDPVRARDMAQAYLDELNKLITETNTSTAHQERVFIERRLHSVEADLARAQQDLSEFSSRNSTINLSDQTRAMVDAAAKVQAEMLVEQSGLDAMRQIYGDSNVRVRESEARIATLQHELTKMSGSSAPLAAASSGAGNGPEYGGDAAELYPPLRQLPRLAVPYADLVRRVKVQDAVYELLTQQYELARIEEAKDIPVVSVIDPPGIPEKKSFPHRLILALSITAFSFVCTSAILLMRHRWAMVDSTDPRKLFADNVLSTLRQRTLRLWPNRGHR